MSIMKVKVRNFAFILLKDNFAFFVSAKIVCNPLIFWKLSAVTGGELRYWANKKFNKLLQIKTASLFRFYDDDSYNHCDFIVLHEFRNSSFDKECKGRT